MVERPGIITPEIAKKYSRSAHTVSKIWTRQPDWPEPVSKRGKYLEYDPAEVEAWVAENVARAPVELEPSRLYTVQEISAETGLAEGTIRSYRSRGDWPGPDDTAYGVDTWRGETVMTALARRRRRKRGRS